MNSYSLRRCAAILVALSSLCLRAQDSAATRAAFLKIIERPIVPLAPEVKELPAPDGLLQEHFTFASDAEQRVPGILIKQAKSTARMPVVIALHGTSGKKESNRALLEELASRGFIAIAIDGRYHGERTKAGSGDVEYNEAIARAFSTGKEHPFYFDTVWDIMRLIDYLETRADADPKRIGTIGFSKGGIETYLVAAVDPRIAVAVPCIGVQSFRWGLEHDGWKARLGTIQKSVNAAAKETGSAINVEFARRFFDRLVPGIYGQFDGPEMLPLIAPRPLLVINGDTDKNTPLPGVIEAADAARSAYKQVGGDDKFKLIIQEKTGHAVNPGSRQAAIEWFVKWLKPVPF